MQQLVVVLTQAFVISRPPVIRNNDSKLSSAATPSKILKEILEPLRKRLVGCVIQVVLAVQVLVCVGATGIGHACETGEAFVRSHDPKDLAPDLIARGPVEV